MNENTKIAQNLQLKLYNRGFLFGSATGISCGRSILLLGKKNRNTRFKKKKISEGIEHTQNLNGKDLREKGGLHFAIHFDLCVT